jgi:1,2-diacylglycerol 3-alpha-glucosyltransferase
MKIAALTTVSGPYIVARYSAFATKFPKISFFLIELGRVSAIYSWNSELITPYERIVLSNQPAETQSSINLFRYIAKTLAEIQPDALVICGYGVPGMREALLWSLLHNKPAVLLSDTKEDDHTRNSWRETLKSLLISKYKAALVAGQPQKRYLIKLGMPTAAIFLGYDVVGNDNFHPAKIKHLLTPIEKPFFLAINRFVPKKNLSFLISCYAAYRDIAGNDAWDLVLCGDGELRPQIEQQIAELGLKHSIHLPGFLQQDEMLPYFAHASCFIHASIQEQWGLVVNEAMAAGLPVLVSNRCGCFEDLIKEGINGFGFNPNDSQQLTQLMVKISSGEVDLQAMGQASLKRIEKFSPDDFAEGLMQAVEYALAHR